MANKLTKQEKFLRICKDGNPEKVKKALDEGASVDASAKIYGVTSIPLFIAYRTENYEVGKILIERGADYFKCFMLAVTNNDIYFAEFLIKCGADINFIDKKWGSILSWAIVANATYAVKWLIELGADVNKKLAGGHSAFTYAFMNITDNPEGLDPEIIKILMNSGADYRDAMILALENNVLNFIKFLIKYGADVNVKLIENQSPLSVAMMCLKRGTKIDVLKFLLKNGADANEIIKFDDGAITNNLNISISINRPDVAKILLQYGANPNFRDHNGRTALFFAVLTGNKILRTLLTNGADPDIQDYEGRTPLMLAAIDGESEDGVIDSLIKFGADLNIQDRNGMTVLMWAIIARDKSTNYMTSALIRTGGFMSKGGITCLAVAFLYAATKRELQLEIIKRLIDSGADLSIKDKKGMNALMHAMASSDDDIVKILLDAGAMTEMQQKTY